MVESPEESLAKVLRTLADLGHIDDPTPLVEGDRLHSGLTDLRVTGSAAAQGWRLTGETFTGELRAGEPDTLRVALRDGVHYALAVVCDGDCRDLALTVVDDNDAILARSAGAEGSPLLEVRPAARGKYRVVVTMGRCEPGPCPYGIGILTK